MNTRHRPVWFTAGILLPLLIGMLLLRSGDDEGFDVLLVGDVSETTDAPTITQGEVAADTIVTMSSEQRDTTTVPAVVSSDEVAAVVQPADTAAPSSSGQAPRSRVSGQGSGSTLIGGTTTTFSYDYEDRLTSQTTGGSTVQHTYDGQGNRIARNDNGDAGYSLGVRFPDWWRGSLRC